MALKPVTVSQLNEYINRIIGTDPLLGAVVVKGEISNLKYHSTGHVYFSIIDDASKLNCFFHREYAYLKRTVRILFTSKKSNSLEQAVWLWLLNR